MEIFLFYSLAFGNIVCFGALFYLFKKSSEKDNDQVSLGRRHRRFKMAFDMLANIAKFKKKEDRLFYQCVYQEMEKGLGFRKGTVVWLNEETQVLEMKYSYGYPKEYVEYKRKLGPSKVGRAIDGLAVLSKQPVVANDVLNDPTTRYLSEIAKVMGIKAFFSTPIILNGRAIGAFNVGGEEMNCFGLFELRIFSVIASFIALRERIDVAKG